MTRADAAIECLKIVSNFRQGASSAEALIGHAQKMIEWIEESYPGMGDPFDAPKRGPGKPPGTAKSQTPARRRAA